MRIEKVKIDEIKPYEGNAKLHPQEQIEQIKQSIMEFGNNDPIAIDKHGVIIEGHGRYLALKELGYTEVEVIRLDHLTDEQRKAYTLIHNKLTMNTGFDLEQLEIELKQIESIDMSQYDFELPSVEIPDDQIEEDDYEVEVPEDPISKRGQIYQLGRHRLMVGDSTDSNDVAKLMGGAIADLVVTDPPYNVNYQGGTKEGMTIINDDMDSASFQAFLTNAFSNMVDFLKKGGSFYIWFASREHINFETALNNVGLQVRQELIWNKNALILGRQDYQWKHEPCLYGWKDGAPHYFIDDRKQTTVHEDGMPDISAMKKEDMRRLLEEIYSDRISTTVINENKPARNDLHPTMKPIKLLARLIKNSSKIDQNVLDLFGGSGSTLIACEQLERSCYMMEYDPRYADVIIDRWETMTGEQAVLLNE